MAITAPMQRSDFNGFLTPDKSEPIFNDAWKISVFQQLFRKVPLGINGQEVPVITSKPTANWVSEGQRKPATNMGLGKLTITPRKLSAIAILSAETVRANPGGINDLIRPALAEAFAVAFDNAVGFNVGGDGTGTGPFGDYALSNATKEVALGSTTQANGGIHGDFVAAMRLLVNDDKKLTGFALDSTVEPEFWGATDSTGRPLYTELPLDESAAVLAQQVNTGVARPGLLLNRPARMSDGVGQGTVAGFAGDFTKGVWGAVGGINYRVSTEAPVTINGELVSLFENNLVAVLAEAEYGYANADVEAYVRLTETAGEAGGA